MTDRIEKSIEIKAPVLRVWRALTDYREFGQWFRVKLEAPFEVGKVARGSKLDPCNGNASFEATIKTMQAEQCFAFTWHPYAIDPKTDRSKEPQTLVEFVLERIPSGTLLKVTESGFDKIPLDRRTEVFRMHEAGWIQQIENIERHVG